MVKGLKVIIFREFNIATKEPTKFLKELNELCSKYAPERENAYYTYELEQD